MRLTPGASVNVQMRWRLSVKMARTPSGCPAGAMLTVHERPVRVLYMATPLSVAIAITPFPTFLMLLIAPGEPSRLIFATSPGDFSEYRARIPPRVAK